MILHQTALHFDQLLLPSGWEYQVRLHISDGLLTGIAPGTPPAPDDECHAIGIPGLANLHSHAFQRGMAGLAERRGPSSDSFWTWRETMYRFVERLTPDDLFAIAGLAYAEMLETGFTRVGEFHYLHHDRDGTAFADPAQMSAAIIAAAEETGIALTHLPAFYPHSGFGGLAPHEGQRRFLHDIDGFDRLIAALKPMLAALPDAVLGVAPHSLRAVTADELAELTELASCHAAGPVHIHIAEQKREVEECLAWSGRRPVEWLLDHADVDERWCLIHATHMTGEETWRLAFSKAVAGLCPITEANLGDGIFPAGPYARAGGRYGLGSDSHVMIDASEEMRWLEYGQRLTRHGRNILAAPDRPSTGAAIFHAALAGGAQALKHHAPTGTAGLHAGMAADIVSLDARHPSLIGRRGDALLDGWIFGAGRKGVDCVWRRGEKIVRGGQHRMRFAIADRYGKAMNRLLE